MLTQRRGTCERHCRVRAAQTSFPFAAEGSDYRRERPGTDQQRAWEPPQHESLHDSWLEIPGNGSKLRMIENNTEV